MNHAILYAALAIAVGAGLLWGNRAIRTTHISLAHPALPEHFDGFRIAHITDLHNTRFGQNHKHLLTHLMEAQPDIIAITGDMIDARRTDINCALEFATIAVTISPCYYVMGNHEARIPQYPEFERGLRDVGVQVLRNETVRLEHDSECLTIIGVDDPAATEGFADTIATLRRKARGFTVLLSHRPERFETYCEANVDLALCGHAHGGQVRLPFIGGVIAPHQGFFPKYDSGLYTRGPTNMILSRGLGNSLCPLRVNNRPELVVVELHHSE